MGTFSRFCALELTHSTAVAFFEYSMQVPANRIGHMSHGGPFSTPVLRVLAELFSLVSFAIFSVVILNQNLTWADGVGFALILAGVAVAMGGREIIQRKEKRELLAAGLAVDGERDALDADAGTFFV